jgi:hypothetical protein
MVERRKLGAKMQESRWPGRSVGVSKDRPTSLSLLSDRRRESVTCSHTVCTLFTSTIHTFAIACQELQDV